MMVFIGKGLQGKKTADTPKAIVDVSEESDSKPARKQTSHRRVIKKNVSISIDNNIIPKPYVSLELGKSISLTKAAEGKAARQVHATHERIMIESDPEPARLIPSGIALRDTSRVSKKMSPDPSQKLKGSSEGTGVSLRVFDESTIITATSSEGTGTKLGVPDEEKVTSKANVILDLGSEQESEYIEEDDDDENIEWVDTDEEEEENDDDDDKSIDLEKINDEETDNEFVHSEKHVQDVDEETDDEFVHGDEQMNADEDEEMSNAKYADTGNGGEDITEAAKADAEKAEEVKNDVKKAELPPSSSSLSVSSCFSNQFLNLSFDTSIIDTVKDTTDAEINSLLDVQIQQKIPHIKSSFILAVPVYVISEPSVLTPIPETPSIAHATTLLPPSSVFTISPILLQTPTPIPTPPITIEAPPTTMILDPLPGIIQRVFVLEKYVQEIKEVDHNATLLASLRAKIMSAVNAYLGSSLGDTLQKMLQRHTEELIQQYPQQVNYKEMIEESVQANLINEFNY
ncbi:hypothetical protein Tco_0892581 [Tanacetum coccineum]|uniref:Uncharacterized protein n=1 Tax=Tanacetum coccineum TaxID=301880 RepID=A0ABQ5CCC0_9ASTR